MKHGLNTDYAVNRVANRLLAMPSSVFKPWLFFRNHQ